MFLRLLKYGGLIIVFAGLAAVGAYFAVTLMVREEATVVVPDLRGKNVVKALTELTNLGLNIRVTQSFYSDTIPENDVVDQQPEPGTEVKKGRDVRLILSKGAKVVLVPDLSGLAADQAGAILEDNGLCTGVVSHTHSTGQADGFVIAQDPEPGGHIGRTTCVDMLVSLGPAASMHAVPDLKGQNLASAVFRIEQSGFTLGEVINRHQGDQPFDTIVDQFPLPGARGLQGEPIQVVINRREDRIAQSETGAEAMRSGLYRYGVPPGFLKHQITAHIQMGDVNLKIFDKMVRPDREIWLLVPRNTDVTLMLYDNGLLADSQRFAAW